MESPGSVARSVVIFDDAVGEPPRTPDPIRDLDELDAPRSAPPPPLPSAAVYPGATAIARALACLAGTWAIVSALTTILTPSIGASWALVPGLALALVPVAVVAIRIDGGWKWVELESTGVGLILGFFLLPSILLPIGGLPEVVLAGYEPRIDPALRTLPPWLTAVLLAPVLEELVYRKLLLQALAPRVGAVAAVILVSVLFACCHVGPWSWFGTATAGVFFGTLVILERSTAICIGMHAGFHVAALYTGIRPWEQPLPLVALSPPLVVLTGVGAALIYWFALVTSFRPKDGPTSACFMAH